MVRKSPDKQWNRQNSILFHETIPLIFKGISCTLLYLNHNDGSLRLQFRHQQKDASHMWNQLRNSWNSVLLFNTGR
jgi:hypothetical protein